MPSEVHDAVAFCRYESDRCIHSVKVSKALRGQLYLRLTLLLLQRAKNLRIRKKLVEDRKLLGQQLRILEHGRTAKFVI
jgi:hypothetical protein